MDSKNGKMADKVKQEAEELERNLEEFERKTKAGFDNG